MSILFQPIGRRERIILDVRGDRAPHDRREYHYARLIDPCRGHRVANGKALQHANPLRVELACEPFQVGLQATMSSPTPARHKIEHLTRRSTVCS